MSSPKRKARLLKQRSRMKRLATERISAGLCPKCGEPKTLDTRTCAVHAEMDRKRKRKVEVAA